VAESLPVLPEDDIPWKNRKIASPLPDRSLTLADLWSMLPDDAEEPLFISVPVPVSSVERGVEPFDHSRSDTSLKKVVGTVNPVADDVGSVFPFGS